MALLWWTNKVTLKETANLSAWRRQCRPSRDRSRPAPRELKRRVRGERARGARGRRQPLRRQCRSRPQSHAAMVFRSGNVSTDCAPPRGPFVPGRMRRRSRPHHPDRPAIRSVPPSRVRPGRNCRQMRVLRDLNVAGASARRRLEIPRQAAKLRSLLRRDLALGRRAWRSIDPRIVKRRAHLWRQGPPMLRLAPAQRNRSQIQRNACKGPQAPSRRSLVAVSRLRRQAHKRRQAPSRGGRRSTPRRKGFRGQGAGPAADRATFEPACAQQTVRVDCALSRSQICDGQGHDSTKLATFPQRARGSSSARVAARPAHGLGRNLLLTSPFASTGNLRPWPRAKSTRSAIF